MLNAELNSSNDSYILMRLFLDAMNKIGKQKKVKSMGYTCDNGLVVIDENDIAWSLKVNAEVKFPEELCNKPNAKTSDSNATYFCVDCNSGIKNSNSNSELICSVCEYLNRS
jgi:hypothetical protein